MLPLRLLAAASCAVASASASASVTTTVKLNDGKVMPVINLGTCCGSKPSVGLPAWLGGNGQYPLAGIDTAFDYNDQADIAKVIAGRNRSDYFVLTKIPAGLGNASDCYVSPFLPQVCAPVAPVDAPTHTRLQW